MKVKNLTRRMKDFLVNRKLNPDEWYYIVNTPKQFVVVNKETKEERLFEKVDYQNVYF